MGAARISVVSVTDPKAPHSLLHGDDLNRVSGSELILINALLIERHLFPILYPYMFHCISMQEDQKLLGDLFTCHFYVWTSPAMKGSGNNTNELLSKTESEQDRDK